jgi:hypothetical protein
LKTEGDILDRAILTPCFVNSRTSEQPISSSGYPARLCSNGSFVPQPLRSRPCRERALLELWQELITRLHRLPRTRGKLDLSKRTSLNYSALRSEAQSGANTLQKETGVSIIILCLRYSKLFLASLGRTRAIRRSAHVVVKRRGGGHNQKASGHAVSAQTKACYRWQAFGHGVSTPMPRTRMCKIIHRAPRIRNTDQQDLYLSSSRTPATQLLILLPAA